MVPCPLFHLRITPIVLVITSLGAFGQERHVASSISAVTIFADRAQVTRTCSEELPAGEQLLIFDHLPESIEQSSITVDGSGNGLLKEVKFRQEPLAGYADSLTRALSIERIKLEDAIAAADDRIKQRGSERQFVENIAMKVTDHGTTQQAVAPDLDSQKWQTMLDFYRTRLEAIDQDIRETTRTRGDLNDSLGALVARMANIGRDPRGSRNQAVVAVYLKEQGQLTINLSYVVIGPSWSPSYELRAKTGEKTLSMTYKATIRQNTGEDWTNAGLKLSTARPSIGGAQPNLIPWRIDFYTPPEPRALLRERVQGLQMANSILAPAPAGKEYGFAGGGGGGGGIAGLAPPLEVPAAAVSSGGVNAVFEIPGATTIKSDNEEHTATIMTKEFAASFRYSTVPKLSPHAFLKAKIKNETDYPLLAGSAGIFLNNTFVATSKVEEVQPGQEFWTFLGADDGIKVERKLINRVEEQGGMFSKKTKITFNYEISVTNGHAAEEEVVVFDQLPLSGNEEIHVDLIEPRWKENTAELHKNDQDILEWYYKIKPDEKIVVPLKFSVEYPEGKNVPGL
jgi:uncharacterized protein (TIGR02231 family)